MLLSLRKMLPLLLELPAVETILLTQSQVTCLRQESRLRLFLQARMLLGRAEIVAMNLTNLKSELKLQHGLTQLPAIRLSRSGSLTD